MGAEPRSGKRADRQRSRRQWGPDEWGPDKWAQRQWTDDVRWVDVLGVPTLLVARTDAEAADLLTSDIDGNDKPFTTGERTVEGFYKTRNGLDQAISRGLAYAPYADLVW